MTEYISAECKLGAEELKVFNRLNTIANEKISRVERIKVHSSYADLCGRLKPKERESLTPVTLLSPLS
jgi:hypothetical protein